MRQYQLVRRAGRRCVRRMRRVRPRMGESIVHCGRVGAPRQREQGEEACRRLSDLEAMRVPDVVWGRLLLIVDVVVLVPSSSRWQRYSVQRSIPAMVSSEALKRTADDATCKAGSHQGIGRVEKRNGKSWGKGLRAGCRLVSGSGLRFRHGPHDVRPRVFS